MLPVPPHPPPPTPYYSFIFFSGAAERAVFQSAEVPMLFYLWFGEVVSRFPGTEFGLFCFLPLLPVSIAFCIVRSMFIKEKHSSYSGDPSLSVSITERLRRAGLFLRACELTRVCGDEPLYRVCV